MQRHDVAWESGSWTTQPVFVREEQQQLLVEAAKGSDFWERTLYGFQRESGHALLAPWAEHSALEVSFDLRGFDELYDQAGLMLRASATHWIKAGVEVNDGVPHVGAVVTHGHSDWSLAPVAAWAGKVVTIRASRSKDAVILRAMIAGEPWRTIRVAHFEPEAAVHAGPFVCAPQRAGLRVRFTRWVVTDADPELHWSPPASD
jgi:hypothetical protein